MRYRWVLASVSLVCLGVCAASTPEKEYLLRYRPSDRLQQEVGWMESQTLSPLEKKPSLAREPAYGSKKPLYFSAKLGRSTDNQYMFVLHRSRRGKTVYVDLNRDRIIAEDEKLASSRREGALWFGPASVRLKSGDEEYLYRFSLMKWEWEWEGESLALQAACYNVGTVELNGKSHKMAVVDANGNGLFNDLGEGPWEGDKILLDLNGNGAFETEENADEAIPMTRLLHVSGQYHALNIPPDGSTIRISEPSAKFGLLTCKLPAFEVLLSSKEWGPLSLKGDKGGLKVPVGRYELKGYTFAMKDAKGREWKLQSYSRGSGKRLEVREEGATAFRFGFPLKTEVESRGTGRQVDLDVSLTGSSGEEVSSITVNGQRPPAPRMRIFTAGGKLLGTYALHYG